MTLARRLLAHAPVNALQAAAGVIGVAAFTRFLAPEDFGRYAMVLAIAHLAHTLALTWAEAAAFRFLGSARLEGRLTEHFATLAGIAALSGLAACAATAGLCAGLVHDPALAAAAGLAGAAVILRFVARLAREGDRADLRVARYSWKESAYTLICLGAGVGLALWSDLGALAPLAGLVIGGAMIAAGDLLWLTRAARGGRACPQRAARYFCYGAPLACALAIDLLVQAGVRVGIAVQLGEAAVGAYAAAFALARLLDLLFVWVGSAVGPVLLAAYQERGPRAASALTGPLLGVLLALGLPAAVGLGMIAAPLSAAVIGPALADQAGRTLPWLAAAGLLTGLSTYYASEPFQLAKRTGLRAWALLAPALMGVGLSWWWAGIWGLAGAAAGTCAGAGCSLIALWLIGRRLVRLALPLREIGKIALAAVAMAACVSATPAAGGLGEALLKAAVGGLVYGGAVVLLDILGARGVLKALLGRVRASVPMPERTPDDDHTPARPLSRARPREARPVGADAHLSLGPPAHSGGP